MIMKIKYLSHLFYTTQIIQRIGCIHFLFSLGTLSLIPSLNILYVSFIF